jgi:hypothetical protein
MGTRRVAVNAEFTARIGALVTSGVVSEGLGAGALAALGVPYGSTPDPAEFPLLGFYLEREADAFRAYLLTPGRFIRYEVAGAASLTVTVPLSRVTRVVEETSGDPPRVTLTVELDADAVVVAGEYVEQVTDDQARQQGRSLSRARRSTYTMTATTREDAEPLMRFAVAVRSAVGA